MLTLKSLDHNQQSIWILAQFIGCDTVSSFSSRGKIASWETFKAFSEITSILLSLSNEPVELQEAEKTLLYCRTTELTEVNKCRRWFFTTKVQISRQYTNIRRFSYSAHQKSFISSMVKVYLHLLVV